MLTPGLCCLSNLLLTGPSVIEQNHEPWYQLSCSFLYSQQELPEIDIKVMPLPRPPSSLTSPISLLSVVFRVCRVSVPAVGSQLRAGPSHGGPERAEDPAGGLEQLQPGAAPGGGQAGPDCQGTAASCPPVWPVHLQGRHLLQRGEISSQTYHIR